MSSNSSDSVLVSQGTCYFGAGQLADPRFIPCGNAEVSGPQACCFEGDYCLSSNTCWDKETAVTYISGCTDPDFRSSKCPQRFDYPDQQWVALARCDGDDINLWTGCAHHPDQIELEKENCNCNMSSVLIDNPNGKDAFDEIGLLPNVTGQALDWNPTAIPTETASSRSGRLSTGAQAGIGVGVAIAGLLLIAGAVLFFFILPRRRRKQEEQRNFKSELDGGDARYETTELAGEHYRGVSIDSNGHKSGMSPESGMSELENNNDYNGVTTRPHGSNELGLNTPHPEPASGGVVKYT